MRKYYFIKCIEKSRENDFMIINKYGFYWTNDIVEATKYNTLKECLHTIEYLYNNYAYFDLVIKPIQISIPTKIHIDRGEL